MSFVDSCCLARVDVKMFMMIWVRRHHNTGDGKGEKTDTTRTVVRKVVSKIACDVERIVLPLLPYLSRYTFTNSM